MYLRASRGKRYSGWLIHSRQMNVPKENSSFWIQMNLLDCSKYSRWDCGAFSTPQVDNKEMMESQTKEKLDFLCTPACPLAKLQIITYNFTYCRRNDENPASSLQSLHYSYLSETIPKATVTCKERFMAWMATSSSFQKANKHISQFHEIQTCIQMSGFIIRLAIALSLKTSSSTSKW